MKKNLYLYICIGVLFVFTIGYFITANSISYAFTNPYEEDSYIYKQEMIKIKIAGMTYLKNHPDVLKKEDTIYITVDDLVNDGLIEADSDGIVKDPTNPIKSLNNIKIKLSKDEVKVLS